MDFTRTAKAALTATVIAGVMIGMSAFSSAVDDSVRAREEAVISATQENPDTIVPQVTEQATIDRPAYLGIEPDHTEETLPERAGFTYYPDIDLDRVTQDFIFVEAGEAGVDYELVLAIIIHESRCDPDAISSTGDYGLMQINKCNHAWLAEEYGLTDMLDPRQNIIAGITILSQLYRFNDGTDAGLHKVLMAYTMGPTGASNAWAVGTYITTYSKTVMQIRDDLICGEYTKGA